MLASSPKTTVSSAKISGPEDLRLYQLALAEMMKQPGNFILSLPTGMGKTVIAWHVVHDFYQSMNDRNINQFTIILVAPTLLLCKQHAQSFRQFADQWDARDLIIRMPTNNAQFYPLFRKTLMITTPGKLMNLLDIDQITLDDIQMAVIDEVHNADKKHVMVPILEIIKTYNNNARQSQSSPIKVIGLSATPTRMRNASGPDLQADIESKLAVLEGLLDDASTIVLAETESDELRSSYISHKKDVCVLTQAYIRSTYQYPTLKRVFNTLWNYMTECIEHLDLINPSVAMSILQAYSSAFSVSHSITDVADVVSEGPVSAIDGFLGLVRNAIPTVRAMLASPKPKHVAQYANLHKTEAQLNLISFYGVGASLLLKYGPRACSTWIYSELCTQTLESLDADTSSLIQSELGSIRDIQTDMVLKTCLYIRKELGTTFVSTNRVLVFAATTDDVYWVAYTINTLCQRRVAGVVVGTNAKPSKIQLRVPMKVFKSVQLKTNSVDAFRAGEIHVLVSTTVSEEGMDIPSCTLVIRLDRVNSAVQLGQSKGRARSVGGRMVVMCPTNSNVPIRIGASSSSADLPGLESRSLNKSKVVLSNMETVTQKIGGHNFKMYYRRNSIKPEPGTESSVVVNKCRFRPSCAPRTELEQVLRILSPNELAHDLFDEAFSITTNGGIQVQVNMRVPERIQMMLGGHTELTVKTRVCCKKSDARKIAFNMLLGLIVCPNHLNCDPFEDG